MTTYLRALRAARTYIDNAPDVPKDARRDDIVSILAEEIERFRDLTPVKVPAPKNFQVGDVLEVSMGYSDIPKGAFVVVERTSGDKYLIRHDATGVAKVVKGNGLRYPVGLETTPAVQAPIVTPEEADALLDSARIPPVRRRGRPRLHQNGKAEV